MQVKISQQQKRIYMLSNSFNLTNVDHKSPQHSEQEHPTMFSSISPTILLRANGGKIDETWKKNQRTEPEKKKKKTRKN